MLIMHLELAERRLAVIFPEIARRTRPFLPKAAKIEDRGRRHVISDSAEELQHHICCAVKAHSPTVK